MYLQYNDKKSIHSFSNFLTSGGYYLFIQNNDWFSIVELVFIELTDLCYDFQNQ